MNKGLTVSTSTQLLDGTEYPQAFLDFGGAYGSVQMAEPIDRKQSMVPAEWVQPISQHLLRHDVVLAPRYVKDAISFWANS